ncbi:hypothetical protein [Dyadobacter chenhuakuii]|uniref:Uncharacterized protein n=1 Tax=Dyadobacter chenhuakuii TaxID=2909339 RepID=A0A9X1QEJ1_9BACT|nr:hypothetical protein [Dyadobacter chenhuakuii]MCF2498349.1 hypothetical protein [Dyadobacter chenhuakuii]
MEISLTVNQAIKEGFEFCGIEGIGFQGLQYIADLAPEEILTTDYRLFSKETVFPCINKDSLIDRAIDDAYDSLEFDVDTSDIRDSVKEAVDWEAIVEKLNESLSTHTFHSLTNIKLIP